MLNRLLAAILARPRTTVLCWVAVIAIGVAGALRLEVDFSSAAFYAEEAEALAELQEFSERWGPDDRSLAIVLTAEGAPMLSEEQRAGMEHLARKLEQSPAVLNVVGLHQLPDLPLTVLRETEAVPLLLSEDGTVASVLVELRESTDDPQVAVAALASVEAILEQHEVAYGVALRPAGIPATRAAFIELAVSDQMVLGPLAAGLAGMILFVAWRRTSLVLAAGAGAGIPVVLLLGAMGWSGEPIGLLNQAYFTLLPVIALADTVHLVVRATHLHQEHPDRPVAETIREAATRVGWACLLTSLTTGLGFAALVTTSLPMLQRFGLYAALGIAFAYVTVVMLMPVLLLWTGINARPRRPSRVVRRIAHACVHHPWTTLAIAGTLCLAASIPASEVRVDNHLSHLLEPSHPVRQASEIVDAELGGTLAIELELEVTEGRRFETAALREGMTLLRRQLAEPAVRVILGPSEHGPFTSFHDEERGIARISIRTRDIGGRAFAELLERARTEAAHAFPGASITATGSAAVAYDGVNRITGQLRRSLVGLLLLVTVLIGLLLRGADMGLRSILPNVLPLWLGYAAVGLAGIELDPIAAVVLALALGIAVDDTIHIMVRFKELRATGIDSREAAVIAIQTSGEAVVLTSICLSVGLASNVASSFPPLVVLGWLGSGVIVLAMLADITVLPALLVLGAPASAPTRAPAPRTGSEPASEE